MKRHEPSSSCRSGSRTTERCTPLLCQVPMKKQDVDDLLDALSISAGNAAVVLSQVIRCTSHCLRLRHHLWLLVQAPAAHG